ncbi:MAG: translation elongation factor Ts [Planctomycetota bacterium]|jgi:elongation factor Ts|nr:translation elongation factor Ts [Planctomycetota bacterium]MEC7430116.1 translation elongation factor Ts [Planctomycetota bacterium]MEC7448196.1 translation elongation factor Ts [Planctomycetota bacterium]MEC7498614.1 translation elongation factor Ts [Planctomycetota bacterium]MEC7718169.1 translation elongation factor Ts [Planctomycetota bacterium]
MAEITAAAVMALRKKTGLPMMDCKSALAEAGGDEDKAVELLRKRGAQVLAKRSDRETSFGRFGLYCGSDKPKGAMVELMCESAPVTSNEEFVQLANDLAEQLATGPGAATAEELLDQQSPSKDGMTLRQQKDDLFNRIREVFNVGRMVIIEGTTGGYSHNSGTVSGVIVGVEGGSDELARDVSMHVAAMRPAVLNVSDLPADEVAKEREILKAAALEEGKPENIVEKMVDGRMRNYYAERVLLEQPFVKDDKNSVGKFAESNGMKVTQFVHWELGE